MTDFLAYIWEPLDEGMSITRYACFTDELLAFLLRKRTLNVRHAISDILEHGTVEQYWLLSLLVSVDVERLLHTCCTSPICPLSHRVL